MRSRGVVDVSTRSAEGVESVLDPLAEDLGPGPRDHSRGERSVRFQKLTGLQETVRSQLPDASRPRFESVVAVRLHRIRSTPRHNYFRRRRHGRSGTCRSLT